ncbi:MAG: alpha-2-macroglobulin family protein [Ferruginibacter sp.]|nr:alpha-2-macroglobulin [Ferruginibacter sp.]
MAQIPNEYAKEWKKVSTTDGKGLTKDAQKIVEQIFNDAIKTNNDPQQIKAAMHIMKYRNMVEEDNQQKNIFYVDTLIAKTKAPSKNILQSMQAQLFQAYKEEHRYQLYNRTALAEEKGDDITTWSITKLNEKISLLYKASLKNEDILKNTKLDGLDAIIQKGLNSRNLRPTLFDFLGHRALDYFMSTENDVTNPAYKFIINDEAAFAPIEKFATHNFKTKDTASLYFNAIKLMQALLAFHAIDTQPEALLDADLKRLDFVNQHGVFTNKEKLYENALLHIETKYANNPTSAQASYLRAQILMQNAEDYNPLNNTVNQFEIVKAKQICEAAYAKFPKSEGGINCKNLLSQIETPSLHFITEKVNVNNQAFKALVQFKNVQNIYCRVVKITREEIKKIETNTNYETVWPSIIALKPTKAWTVKLPDQKDYQEHSTEIKIDALPQGSYYLLMSMKENFSLNDNIIGRITTYVSNISYITNNKNELYVLDRDNGKPLENASVQLWNTIYNNNTRQNEEVKGSKYITDKNGLAKIAKAKNYENSFVQIKYANDELFTNDGYNSYYYDYYNQKKNSTKRTFLFTDRSIYRPGQTIFFKGIMTETDSSGRNSKVITDKKTTVILYDNNGQKAISVSLTTNSYGSYNGSFKIPDGLLNGSFRIQDSITNASQYISVEEYKRPKFLAEIKKPEGSYRLYDSIKITGTAKAYAGNNVDGAKVSYRVVRVVRYPDWWGYYRSYNRGSEEMEITNGNTITDAKGEFKITFKAIPDEAVEKKNQPTFDYQIIADITDVNGETRSASTNVSVSYQALKLDIIANEKMNADSIKNIGISTTNTNGLYEKATVNVVLYKLQEPNKIFRKKYWAQADLYTMNKTEYYQNFPYDVYADEDQMSKWELGDKAIDKTDTTTKDTRFKIQHTKLNAGWYKIVATTKDKYGEDVKAEKFIQLTDGNKQLAKEPISIDVKNKIAEPNEKITYNITTGFEKIWLIQNVIKSNVKDNTTYPIVNAGETFTNSIDVNEPDRGGINMNYAFVQHNRFYTGAENFTVPWSNKDLNISYETFRDKLEPGSQEKWKIKITGNKAEKVAAETLISMYDASLDQFKPHNWNKLNLWPGLSTYFNWNGETFNDIASNDNETISNTYLNGLEKQYDYLLNNGWSEAGYYRGDIRLRGVRSVYAASVQMPADKQLNEVVVTTAMGVSKQAKEVSKGLAGKVSGLDIYKNEDTSAKEIKNSDHTQPEIKIRKNFNETAFFFPALQTDADGNVVFSFTMPEALTQWKMLTLAHTKELASAVSTKTTVTQKQLMVQPNAPRFLREADRMEFSAKIVNLTDKEITGTSQLELLDATTNKAVDGWFKNVFPNQYFTIPAGQSVALKFPMEVPSNFNAAMMYRIKAITKDNLYSDGEEAALPVLTNRMLVTESMPFNMRKVETKNFKFDKLLNSASSSTLSTHALTVEYTSNPAWYAVQALPYLMEYPYECAEQSFSRYYANTLASFISNASPKIKQVFERWKITDTAALMSNLQKNEELKSVLLQETPWVLDAQNETQQKKNIALLFDMVRLTAEKNKTLAKLKDMQISNGGFAWFKGGRDDRYITQYIITGIGHLRKLKAVQGNDYVELKPIVDKALPYLDARLKEDYDNLIKYKVKLANNNLSSTAIQYLYMRSFFTETPIASTSKKAVDYYTSQATKYWLSQSKYMQAMIALALHRNNDKKTPKAIIESLKQNSISSEEFGMYWKEFNKGGYYWYQAPIESHAMMVEAFTDIDANRNTIDDLKTWLLKQKQTQNWGTTKATAEACYALLLNGSDWLSEEKTVAIKLGSININSSDDKTEAGTGYFKKRIEGEKVNPQMGNITVEIKTSNNQPNTQSTSWGSAYWQYFEDLDKITSAETPLKLVKKLFIEKNSDKGPILQAIKDGDAIKVGDKIKVRIELRSDRDMEYVHMKDMRASCMEPVNVISNYKYQGGLGYYESTKDASTNFFFGWLPKGTYVFEYPMFVTHNGNYSNGITTIQCMYAPEFTSHSEGVRVNVE